LEFFFASLIPEAHNLAHLYRLYRTVALATMAVSDVRPMCRG